MVNARSAVFYSLLSFCLVPPARALSEAPSTFTTELQGVVSDEQGKPLVGAIVSVFGRNLSAGALVAVTDEDGHFELSGIPPGLYRLRAYLSGFLPSDYAKVLIREGTERASSIWMSLASLESDEDGNEDPTRRRTLAELRWLLQHGDRNVLKDAERSVSIAELHGFRRVPSFEPEFALSGEFGVRAASYEQGLDEFPGSGAGLDARLAYARLFIPANDGAHWRVSAQVLESALSSWAGRAEFVTDDLSGHRLTAGVAYGNYLYGDMEDFRPPEAALTHRAIDHRSTEWFGSVYASDTFLLGSASVRAGMALEYFDYLDRPGYAAPRLEVAYPFDSNEETTVLRGSVEYQIEAPGGEDIGLLSHVAYSDVYGPSPDRRPLRAEATARVQLGLEGQLSTRTHVVVRAFQETATDQLVKAFLKDPPGGAAGAGHFVVANQGDFRTRGFGLALSQRFGAMEGSVGYTFGKAEALRSPPRGDDSLEAEDEIHDVTTRVATAFNRTRTRLQAAYRIVSHPSFAPGREGFVPGTSVDSRFNIQVYQLLPFVGWNGTRWELMLAVRNIFYEDIEDVSILDEIAVVDAPRRVLGGVTVRF